MEVSPSRETEDRRSPSPELKLVFFQDTEVEGQNFEIPPSKRARSSSSSSDEEPGKSVVRKRHRLLSEDDSELETEVVSKEIVLEGSPRATGSSTEDLESRGNSVEKFEPSKLISNGDLDSLAVHVSLMERISNEGTEVVTKKRNRRLSSSSESGQEGERETEFLENAVNLDVDDEPPETRPSKRRSRLISESSDEETERKPRKALQSDSEPESDENKDEENGNSYKNILKNSDLYQAESSDDESSRGKAEGPNETRPVLFSDDETEHREESKPKKAAKAKKKDNKSALDEIHKETQRMIRESRVSLPYHRPKQRTLADFLNRRKTAPIVPLHTSKEKLHKVWEHLEEREKTVATFYKSESDESDGEEQPADSKQPEHPAQPGDPEPLGTEQPVVLEQPPETEQPANPEHSEPPETPPDTDTPDLFLRLDSQLEDSQPKELPPADPQPTESSQKDEKEDKSQESSQNTLLDIQLNITPKISGDPAGVIELDCSPTKPGALGLLKRFMKHVSFKPKRKVEENVQVSVVAAEYDPEGEVVKIKEEQITIKNKESKPGERLIALKATLQQAIAVNREQSYAKRVQDFKLYNDEEVAEPDELDALINEEEEEFEPSSSETESEPEINDVREPKKKKKGSSTFVEEEAEVSENDDVEDEDVEEDVEDLLGDNSPPSSPPKREKVEDDSEDDDSEEEEDDENLAPTMNPFKDEGASPNVSDLMLICSGKFVTQPLKLSDLETSVNAEEIFEESQETTPVRQTSMHPSRIIDSDEEQENSVKKKPTNRIIDSDDEEQDSSVKKKPKKLNFSDDEDDGDVEDNEGEVSEEEEEVEEDENEDKENMVASEAEEEPEEEQRPVNFLDVEAELSGSEWGSADEDENPDMDELEMEAGDEDNIDQAKLQKELGRIHMREILDDDRREVRILQELLLEDGELHSDGPKRQRLYRWSNANLDPSDLKFFNGFGDDEEVAEPEEEDETWRKERHARELFLQKKKLDQSDEIDAFEPVPVVKSSISKPVKQPPVPVGILTSPDAKLPCKLKTQRGSFLNRGEKVLSKLAELTAISCENPIGKTKDKRNMVFAIVSPPKRLQPEVEVGDVTPVTKRLKFPHGSGSAVKRNSVLEKLRLSDTRA